MAQSCDHSRVVEINGELIDTTWNYNDGEDLDLNTDVGGFSKQDKLSVKICLDCHQLMDFCPEDLEDLLEEQEAEFDYDED